MTGGFLAGFSKGIGDYGQEKTNQLMQMRTAGYKSLADAYLKLADSPNLDPRLGGEYLRRADILGKAASNPFNKDFVGATKGLDDLGGPLREHYNQWLDQQHAANQGTPAPADWKFSPSKAPTLPTSVSDSISQPQQTQPQQAPQQVQLPAPKTGQQFDEGSAPQSLGPSAVNLPLPPQQQAVAAPQSAPQAQAPPQMAGQGARGFDPQAVMNQFYPNGAPRPYVDPTGSGQLVPNPESAGYYKTSQETRDFAIKAAMLDQFRNQYKSSMGPATSPIASQYQNDVAEYEYGNRFLGRGGYRPAPPRDVPVTYTDETGQHTAMGQSYTSTQTGQNQVAIRDPKDPSGSTWRIVNPDSTLQPQIRQVFNKSTGEMEWTGMIPTAGDTGYVGKPIQTGTSSSSVTDHITGVTTRINRKIFGQDSTFGGTRFGSAMKFTPNSGGGLDEPPNFLQKAATSTKSVGKADAAWEGMSNIKHVVDVIAKHPNTIGPLLGRINDYANKLGSSDVANFAMQLFGTDKPTQEQLGDASFELAKQNIPQIAREMGADDSDAEAAADIITSMRAMNASELVMLGGGSGHGITRMFQMLAPVLLNPYQDKTNAYGHMRGLTSLFVNGLHSFYGNLGPRGTYITDDRKALASELGVYNSILGSQHGSGPEPTNTQTPEVLKASTYDALVKKYQNDPEKLKRFKAAKVRGQ